MRIHIVILLLILNITYSYSYGLRKLVEVDLSPQDIMLKADSLEKEKSMQSYELNYLRSFACFSMTRFTRAVEFADSVINSKISEDDSTLYFNAFIIKAESLLKLYKLEETSGVLKSAMELSKKANKKYLEANVLFMQGALLRKMNLLNQSYAYIHDAVNMLSKDNSRNTRLRVSKILGYLSSYYIEDKLYNEAIEVLNKRKLIVDSIGSINVSSHLIDTQYGYYYAKMAYIAHAQDRRVVAKEYYENYKKTMFSSTPYGKIEINRYLLAIGRYEEVIENNDSFFLYTETDDTSSALYQRSISESAEAYAKTNNYEWAYYTLDKYNRMLVDDLNESSKQLLFEYFNDIEYLHFKTDLEDANKNIAYKEKLLIITIFFLCILLVLFVFIYLDRRSLKDKNRKISELILEISKKKEDKSVCSTEQSSVLNRTDINLPRQVDVLKPCDNSGNEPISEKDRILFEAFHKRIVGEKLFLNYQFQRNDYAEIMGVDKNRFAIIIKEFSGKNLNSYINEMRLEHSVFLFRTHPEMSITEVAEACALPSSTTFYRLFKEKYGISPKVFREQLNK